MSQKKRKHHEQHVEVPRKKAASSKLSGVLKVNWLQGSQEIVPAIGKIITIRCSASFANRSTVSSPGLSLPSNLKFEPYTKNDGSKSELLLHSSTHPNIDYVAQEEDDNSENKHYVAVYDSSTQSLQLTEAKHLRARATIRHLQPDSDPDSSSSETERSVKLKASTRADLTQAFGSKKSQKAFAAQRDNKLLSLGDTSTNQAVTSALLSSLPTEVEDPTTSTAQIIQENKPLPQPNLSAESPKDVYTLASLIHPYGLKTLSSESSIPIQPWLDAAAEKQPIAAPSKYIANRISSIALAAATSSDSTTKKAATRHLRTLRYILLLLNLHRLATNHANGKRLPWSPKHWTPGIAGPGTIPVVPVLEGLKARYAPMGPMGSYEMNLLRATICALTLHIPPPPSVATTMADGNEDPTELVTHPGDIREDLALDGSTVRKLYRELGCRIERLDEAGMGRWGIKVRVKKEEEDEDDDKGKVKRRIRDYEIAKLKMPLQFPAVSKGGGPRR